MVDPMAEVIALLKPRAVYSKVISGAGAWAVRYSAFGQPSFCTMLEGQCVLAVDQQTPVTLASGDFVLMPATPGFTLSSPEPAVPVFLDPTATQGSMGELRHGRQTGEAEVRMLGGYFEFDSPDAALLVSLLPVLLHVRGIERLSLLVKLVREESLGARPGRELVLARLVEVLLIEALRSHPPDGAPPGLLRGLADARVAVGLRLMHGAPAHTWTVDA
ncbi:MAG: AraC family transcriptional regulator, partial [Comamonadaceae bacterium]|nr:AraC family transcriptional regulator [Comamonadaceae bacterium]